jgi:hypothetical protein
VGEDSCEGVEAPVGVLEVVSEADEDSDPAAAPPEPVVLELSLSLAPGASALDSV